MGITVAWQDADQRVVHIVYKGQWTNEEFRVAAYEAMALVRTVNHPVYVIDDFSASDGLPLGVFWQASNSAQFRPPNWAGGIAITRDLLLRSLIDIFSRVYLGKHERRVFVANDLEEAHAIIDRLLSAGTS